MIRIVRVTSAQSTRFESLISLWERMVREMSPDCRPNRRRFAAQIESFLQNNRYVAFLAQDPEKQNRPIGFLDGLVYEEPADGTLQAAALRFYVLPQYRGSGAAGRLYRAAMRLAKTYGAEAINITCGPGERRLWQRHGFDVYKYQMRRAL